MYEQFITRQAVLKDNLSLLGYEVGFRAGSVAATAQDSASDRELPSGAFLADAATMVFHWESLVGPHLAFLPLSARELATGAALVLPKSRTVVHLPASGLTDELVESCQNLKLSGYRLCVDSPARDDHSRSLAALADFIWFDFASPEGMGTASVAAGGPLPMVRNIHTWDEHRRARELGFRLFQGRFFLEPQTFRRRTISGTYRSALRLLHAVLADPLDLAAVEQIVRDEPAITYKLLRYLNSPAMERTVEVRSIRNAISLLGEQEFRRWASIVAVATPASEKPGELMRTALTRAYFCEELALQLDRRAAYDFFFTGLLSVMDAVLDQPLSDIVNELAIPANVRDALCGVPGMLRDALQAAQAYEEGEWQPFVEAVGRLAVPEVCAPGWFKAANTRVNSLLL
jgi:EAL and modified HD-GYP domain-containing signal transduction protein